MSLREEQTAFLKDLCKLLKFIEDKSFVATGGELYRTQEQQDLYIKEGKSMTSDSYHLKKLAIDLYFFENGDLIWDKKKLQPVGDYWESLTPVNSWGGNWKRFKDVPHFERRLNKGGL